MLFDYGAGRSFVSSLFNKDFCVPFGSLDRPLEVAIPDNCKIFVSDVYCECMLEIFGVGFPIDLIPSLMRYVCVIVGMDSLSQFEALIIVSVN